MDCFFELLQIALGKRTTLSNPPESRDEWEKLCATVSKHNLLAFTFPVIDELHDTLGTIPLGIYSRWAMVAEKVRKRNGEQIKICRSLNDKFRHDGFRCCVLKGQSSAARYPDPLCRQSGDIDLWMEGDRRKVVDYMRGLCPVRKVVYHHCDADFIPKMGLEIHFTPSWMNSPSANRRLQQWFLEEAGAQFSNYDEHLGFCVTSAPFDAVYMLVHIYRHVLDEGIGLRQLLDYYYTRISGWPQRLRYFRIMRSESASIRGSALGYSLYTTPAIRIFRERAASMERIVWFRLPSRPDVTRISGQFCPAAKSTVRRSSVKGTARPPAPSTRTIS